MTTIAELRDTLALALFSIDVATALYRHGCIRCRDHVDVGQLPDVDAREYRITALCPACWAVLIPPDDAPLIPEYPPDDLPS